MVRQLVGADGSSVDEEVTKMAEGEKKEQAVEEGKANAQGIELPQATNGDQAKADVAAEVADSAMELDGGAQAPETMQRTAVNGAEAKADVAAEVADSAQKLDGGAQA